RFAALTRQTFFFDAAASARHPEPEDSMAFLRQCLHELRATRRDWAPEEMDWFLQTGSRADPSHARLPAAGCRALRPGPARRQGPSIAVHGITHGRALRGLA